MNETAQRPFGTVFAPKMTIAHYQDESWSGVEIVPSDKISLHPGAHVLHYASCGFEGLKAYKLANGSIAVFRLDKHITRMQNTARALALPVPPEELVEELVVNALDEQRNNVPNPPAAMYIRPTLIGTEAAIGKASAPSMTASIYALLSIVGEYFTAGDSGLTLLLEDRYGRTAKGMGSAKVGANYASALNFILRSREEYPDIAQVLFSPQNQVQETGASNFILINDTELLTPALDDSFLPGVTRDSILQLARDMGYSVNETTVTPQDVIEWSKNGGEAALSGTAAVLSPVQIIIYNDERLHFHVDKKASNTAKLCQALQQIQFGLVDDQYGWLRTI